MQIQIILHQTTYNVIPQPLDIAIPLQFNGAQPNSYGVPQATSFPFEGGGFIGDVRQGGSCNFEVYTCIPHCNGTHTECVGHITEARISVHSRLHDSFIPATLITITPTPAPQTKDTYSPHFQLEDMVIEASALKNALTQTKNEFLTALVIRTLPNEESKKSQAYPPANPPFFTKEAMEFIRSQNIQHLLIDTPSVDRLLDEGKLTAHHIFFEVAKNTDALEVPYTITEFIYVPNEILDGHYLLNLQIAPFMADAAPSRPRLFAVEEVD